MSLHQIRAEATLRKSKTVIITGASRGLGRAMAEKFAAHDHNLFLCSKNPVMLEATTQELRTKYPQLRIDSQAADLSDKQQAREFGYWVLDQINNRGDDCKLDILVNNAGQFLPGAIAQEEDGLLEKMIESNLYSAYQLTRVLLKKLLAQKSGHIFNICSIASLHAYPNGGSYSISKAALASFSKNLREELKPHGIKVTAVFPGATYSDSWAKSGIDPKRMMEARDIADILYAASELSQQAVVEDILLRPQLGDI